MVTQISLEYLSRTLTITINLNLNLCARLTCVLFFHLGFYFVHTQQSDKREVLEQQKTHLLVLGSKTKRYLRVLVAALL